MSRSHGSRPQAGCRPARSETATLRAVGAQTTRRTEGGIRRLLLTRIWPPVAWKGSADTVAPLLQERGVFSTQHEGSTVRYRLGLRKPGG
ncbi:hypothetical protein [Streptomyces sp. NBC_01197]|uniref:hypothetical protein n=1 Tax=Streptomyces sp. NBC_01197 TaxID=2903768 RepID=UPI002E14871C